MAELTTSSRPDKTTGLLKHQPHSRQERTLAHENDEKP